MDVVKLRPKVMSQGWRWDGGAVDRHFVAGGVVNARGAIHHFKKTKSE